MNQFKTVFIFLFLLTLESNLQAASFWFPTQNRVQRLFFSVRNARAPRFIFPGFLNSTPENTVVESEEPSFVPEEPEILEETPEEEATRLEKEKQKREARKEKRKRAKLLKKEREAREEAERLELLARKKEAKKERAKKALEEREAAQARKAAAKKKAKADKKKAKKERQKLQKKKEAAEKAALKKAADEEAARLKREEEEKSQRIVSRRVTSPAASFAPASSRTTVKAQSQNQRLPHSEERDPSALEDFRGHLRTRERAELSDSGKSSKRQHATSPWGSRRAKTPQVSFVQLQKEQELEKKKEAQAPSEERTATPVVVSAPEGGSRTPTPSSRQISASRAASVRSESPAPLNFTSTLEADGDTDSGDMDSRGESARGAVRSETPSSQENSSYEDSSTSIENTGEARSPSRRRGRRGRRRNRHKQALVRRSEGHRLLKEHDKAWYIDFLQKRQARIERLLAESPDTITSVPGTSCLDHKALNQQMKGLKPQAKNSHGWNFIESAARAVIKNTLQPFLMKNRDCTFFLNGGYYVQSFARTVNKHHVTDDIDLLLVSLSDEGSDPEALRKKLHIHLLRSFEALNVSGLYTVIPMEDESGRVRGLKISYKPPYGKFIPLIDISVTREAHEKVKKMRVDLQKGADFNRDFECPIYVFDIEYYTVDFEERILGFLDAKSDLSQKYSHKMTSWLRQFYSLYHIRWPRLKAREKFDFIEFYKKLKTQESLYLQREALRERDEVESARAARGAMGGPATAVTELKAS